MDLSPSGFTKSELKRRYFDLSKLYHPDKNSSEEAAVMFLKVVQANEILGQAEKKMMYDLYFQTDFTQEEKFLDALKMQFDNETEREQQFRAYKQNIQSLNSLVDVAPFYFTWLLLSFVFLKDDRKKTKICLFLSCVVFGYGEMHIRTNYGDPEYMGLI
mmetsp:Transcript_17281/g.16489  ORF Transcript_17281/g.16489 Transcript_17281/m.16489 type:complete len:159 (+) Transcript_17281:198-674(+)